MSTRPKTHGPCHPLFDPAKEGDPPPVVAKVRCYRFEGGHKVCIPATFGPEQLTSVEQIAEMFGGGHYELEARDNENQITRRVTITLPGPSRPIVVAGNGATATPVAAPSDGDAPKWLTTALTVGGALVGPVLTYLASREDREAQRRREDREREERARDETRRLEEQRRADDRTREDQRRADEQRREDARAEREREDRKESRAMFAALQERAAQASNPLTAVKDTQAILKTIKNEETSDKLLEQVPAMIAAFASMRGGAPPAAPAPPAVPGFGFGFVPPGTA